MSKINNQSSLTSKYVLPDQSSQSFEAQSNVSSTENMSVSFLKVRTTAKNFAQPQDEIEQTLKLTNESEYTISNISIIEKISSGATFVTGSVKIDGVPFEAYDITKSFGINKLEPNESSTITFSIKIDDSPTTDTITSYSQIGYIVNDLENFDESTNTIQILLQKPDIVIEKSANRNYVVKNDTIVFTNKITNKGDIPVQDVVFKDVLPSDVEFVAGSVLIDQEENLDANPLVGINLKDLQPGDSTEVKFSVLVK